MKLNQKIQENFTAVIHADSTIGIKYADCYRDTFKLHGTDVDAVCKELQAVIDREFNPVLMSARPELKEVYRNFGRAGRVDRINKYHTEAGVVTLSFATDKDTKVITVSGSYKTPAQCERESRKLALQASKEAADEKHAQEQAQAERETLRASATAGDVVKLLRGYLPEISALTEADIVAEWVSILHTNDQLQDLVYASAVKQTAIK